MTTNLARRRFLGTSAAAAGSLVVGFQIPFAADVAAQGATAQGAAKPEINAWVVVRPDDTIVIRIARSEMGQGSLTGLAQLVAEELECDWAKVTTEYPTPGENLARNRVWGNFSTGGSRGIRDSHEYVRKGGAIARTMLVQAAADGWKVPAGECVAANSVITHTPTGRTTTYGKVVADTWWRAKTALDALPIEWDYGPNAAASSASFAAVMKAGLDAKDAAVGNAVGDARAAIAATPRKVEAVYSYPHQNHATMETMNATARYTPERCEVWTPTQNGEAALAAASEASGLPLAQCDVYKQLLGGGFGRRGAVHDWVRQVVAIAKEMPGTPIKLIWSREEDMLHGFYHPVTHCKLTAGVDAQGNVTALHMRISGQSIVAGLFPQNVKDGKDPVVFQGLNPPGPEASIGYTFPALLIDHAMRNPHVPPGFWRGVNLNQNTIYLECFIDELAHATGQDPLAFRRKLMANHPKHLAVLNAVAEKAGWGKPAPAGVYRGLAQTMGFGSYVAACAEVSVNGDGVLKIHRIVAATDPGYAVNPQQIEAQIEGSFAYGLSAALYGECTVKDGRIEQQNFDTYRVLRMDEMPAVETVVVASGGFWGGVGEPTIAVAAPAVLNAIFAATGKRIRDLPLKNHDLKKA